MLSLAVLPLGLIAVQQSVQVIRDARILTERDILSRTLRAAAEEQELLHEALGTARALGIAAIEVGAASTECGAIMGRLIDQSGRLIFAGFISPDGVLRCSSDGTDVDLSERETWQSFIADPRETIMVSRDGAVSGVSVLIAIVPIYDDRSGALLGAVSVSIPHSLTDTLFSVRVPGLSLALISGSGDILTASEGMRQSSDIARLGLVPSGMELTSDGATRSIVDTDGQELLAVMVPLIEDEVFVLGLWDDGARTVSGANINRVAPLFPILMWLAAMTVAYLAIDRLVLRHLREIRGRMSDFSLDQPTDSFVDLEKAPVEIDQIGVTYNKMVARILADRSELARNLAEKDVLIREVHHRVKNNLQLIASILNMQIRRLTEGRERRLLRRVQDRVLSLSVVHRALYDGRLLGSVRADQLLDEVVRSTLEGGLSSEMNVRTEVETAPVMLDADQAVPLALLANEAVTNAIKYVGRTPDGRAEIVVRLESTEGGEIQLLIANTTGVPLIEPGSEEGMGLGARLIDAFAVQLDALAETRVTENRYELSVRFHAIQEVEGDEESERELRFYGSAAHDRLVRG